MGGMLLSEGGEVERYRPHPPAFSRRYQMTDEEYEMIVWGGCGRTGRHVLEAAGIVLGAGAGILAFIAGVWFLYFR